MGDLEEPIGHRYVPLSLLGRGSMGAVYLSRDRLTRELVALKRVEVSAPTAALSATETLFDSAPTANNSVEAAAHFSTPGHSMTAEALRIYHLALTHEFRLLSSLRHPHIVSVLDYGFFAGQPYFTMELLPDCQTLREASAGCTLLQQVGLLAQTLLALIYLHRRGVLHRDLKPSNVLAVGEHVKVVDFGVATAIGYDRSIAGTVEYMAPEILMGRSPSPASDLYAFGVMACELLSGQYPFDRSSARNFLWTVLDPQDLFNPRVDQSLLEVLCQHMPVHAEGSSPESPGVFQEAALSRIEPLALRHVVRRLMRRNPAERFESAEAALGALEAAVGVSFGAAMAETRESFLQAAQLVGRDRELAQLEAALEAARQGQGGLWLVSGESGVGKSRLLDELRAMGLVRGIQVVRGQVQSDGGSAYREWDEALRPLCLCTELSDLEVSVLKALVTGLAELVERPISEPPELDPQATQQRLIHTILNILLRQSTPTLVLLEDVHWSSSESIGFLRRLMEKLPTRPLLVVASYRDEERKELREELAGSRHLQLGRLGTLHVAELSASMLGAAGRSRALVEFLERESEGNTFFMIEVVRALAEEAGSLEAVGGTLLPETLQAGGIQAVLSRRLERVPTEWRRLLLLVAVAGRTIDLPLLRALHPKAEEFLRHCANAAVLEVAEQTWRFSHDKLREAALAALAAAERRALHGQVAAALVQAYAQPETQAARLAYHYQAAEQPTEAAGWAAVAGEQARRTGAMREAVTQLERALSYYDKVEAPGMERARLRRLLGDSHYGLGELEKTLENCQSALLLLGMPLPQQRTQMRWSLGVHGVEFLAALYGLVRPSRCAPEEERRLRELTEVGTTYAKALIWGGKGEEVLLLTLMMERAARRLQSRDGQLIAFSTIASVLLVVGVPGLAARCRENARRLLPNCSPTAYSTYLTAVSLFELMDTRWPELRASTDKLCAESRKQGDLATECYSLYMLTILPFASGRLADLVGGIADLRQLAKRSENAQFLGAADYLESLLALYRGDNASALAHAQTAAVAARQARDKMGELKAQGILGLVELRLGHWPQALKIAEQLLALLGDELVNNTVYVDSVAAPAEIFLTVWQQGWTDDPSVQQNAQRAVTRLGRSVRVNKMNRPRWLLWAGLLSKLRGRGRDQARRALELLEDACESAHRIQLPLEEGRARLELGRILGANDPAGRAHLLRAVMIFQEATAFHYVKQAEALLAQVHYSPDGTMLLKKLA